MASIQLPLLHNKIAPDFKTGGQRPSIILLLMTSKAFPGSPPLEIQAKEDLKISTTHVANLFPRVGSGVGV